MLRMGKVASIEPNGSAGAYFCVSWRGVTVLSNKGSTIWRVSLMKLAKSAQQLERGAYHDQDCNHRLR